MVDSREFGVAFSERTSNMAGNISTSDGFSPLHPLHPLSPAFHPLLAFVSVHLAWQSQQPKCAMSFCFRCFQVHFRSRLKGKTNTKYINIIHISVTVDWTNCEREIHTLREEVAHFDVKSRKNFLDSRMNILKEE